MLEINHRLRLALAEVSEREQTIRSQAESLRRLSEQLEAALAELRATQQQAIQQERLRALGQMASGVAHDLNNALAPVLGFAELLLAQPETFADPEKTRWYVELIFTGARDAAAIVTRLREFYRPRGDGEEFQPVDPGDLVRQVVALTEPRWRGQALAEGRTIDVRTEVESASYVIGSEAELREALTNLVFNAVDAMPQGGTITLRVYEDERQRACPERREGTKDESGVMGGDSSSVRSLPSTLSGAKGKGPSSGRGAEVVLEVGDTGGGMTEEVRRQAVEPFFTTKGLQGTGLGLAMVYGVVHRHDGHLEIQSAPGRGTTVRIALPAPGAAGWSADAHGEPGRDCATSGAAGVPPVPAAPGVDVPGSDRVGRRLRILVVDDDPAVRATTVAFVRAQGHDADDAEDGDAALRHFEAGDYDVVITDRAMPGMSGDQLAAAVKAIRPETTVLLLTGFGDLMHAAGEHPPAIDAVLAKPLSLAHLRDALAGHAAPARLAPTERDDAATPPHPASAPHQPAPPDR